MKILQVVHSLPFLNPAGTETYTYCLSLELAKRNEVYIFSRICDRKQKEYEITKRNMGGITVFLVNNTFKNCNSFQMHYENEIIDKKFSELLDKILPDVVHIQHLVFLSIGLIRIINSRKIPLVFTLHDYWLLCPKWHMLKNDLRPCEKVFGANFDQECPGCLSGLLNIKKGIKEFYLFGKTLLPNTVLIWLKKAYFLCTRKIFSASAGVKKLIERKHKINAVLDKIDLFVAPSACLSNDFIEYGIPAGKIRLVRHGLNSALFQNIQKGASNKIKFAFIGTFLPAKGLHVLIESFNKIKENNAQLKLYGRLYPYTGFEDYLPRLKKSIKNENIRFMGGFDYPEIAKIFSEIDILIVPSIWRENSPLVIQEAFLSRTPVIASRIAGLPELVTDGLNGLLFNPGDPDDLQEKIQYIIDKPELIEEFKKNIPKVKNIKENASGIEEIYNTLISASAKNLAIQGAREYNKSIS